MGVATDVAVLAPWYPSRVQPFAGAFVQAMVEATAPTVDRLTVYHGSDWFLSATPELEERIDRAHAALLPTAVHARPTVGGAQLVTVPVPVYRTRRWAELSRRHEAALRTALGGRPLDAPVVHAHVGLPSGWAAIRNARPDARVFVTEHASYLPLVLEQPDARALYDELLDRCTGFLVVGDPVRAPLVEAFPHHADRIGVIPNPIRFDLPRPAPVTELRRWLYMGGVTEAKGAGWLLEAFAICRADDPALTLTLVGEGQLLPRLQERVAELGLTGAVTFVRPVPPGDALRLMREHDLLAHASRRETFGMTVVEALAAGMPVLATRCGGPEETLAGVEDAAGELVAVEESPDAIVAGYRRLRARFPHALDLARARRVLAGRYSYPAVAAAYRRIWFPGTDTAAPVAGELATAEI